MYQPILQSRFFAACCEAPAFHMNATSECGERGAACLCQLNLEQGVVGESCVPLVLSGSTGLWKAALAAHKVVGPTQEDPPVGFFITFHFLILSSHC